MRRTALLVAPLVLALTPTAASADRGEITEHTPYTLEPGEVRVGFSDVSIGLFGHDLLRRIEVGTRPIAWLPSVLGVPSYDVRGKFELWRDSHLSLAIEAEHLNVDLSRFANEAREDATARFRITPVAAWAGVRLNDRVRLNAGVVHTWVSASGLTSAGDLDRLGGAIGTSSTQLRGNLDFQLAPWLHLVAGGRWVPWQKQWAEVEAGEQVEGGSMQGDVSNTTRGESDLANVGGRAWSAGAELHMTLEHFNLRLGIEYGYYNIPIVNFVVPERGYLPVFDLYWRI